MLVAYAANELQDAGRVSLLEALIAAHAAGAAVLIIEPIARARDPLVAALERAVRCVGRAS